MSAELFAADLVVREKLISLVVSGCKHLVDWFPNVVWCMSTPHAPTSAHVGMWPWQSLRTPQERSLLLWSTYRLRRRGPRSHIRQYVAALRELCIAVRVQHRRCTVVRGRRHILTQTCGNVSEKGQSSVSRLRPSARVVEDWLS